MINRIKADNRTCCKEDGTEGFISSVICIVGMTYDFMLTVTLCNSYSRCRVGMGWVEYWVVKWCKGRKSVADVVGWICIRHGD